MIQEDTGHRCSIECGVIRVFKGRRVMMQERMMGGLYKLIEKVDTHGVSHGSYASDASAGH